MSSKAGEPPSPRYLSLLCEFMAFVHKKSKPYPKDREFTEDEFTAIAPIDLCRWMNLKAFGSTDPPLDAKVTGSGSSSLEFMKKAISFYMPVKENWDHERQCGNPTRSKEVKEVLHRVNALGGGKKKQQEIYHSNTANTAIEVMDSDGPVGLLNRVHDQNNNFIHILNTMGNALRTFTRSVDQIKSALETNNIVIRHELAARNIGAAESISNLAEAADNVPNNFAAMESVIKESTGQVEDSLQTFMNASAVNADMRIVPGLDGFCTFTNTHNNKQMDVPEGFQLPSVDLMRAWRHWITGFPDFKVKNESGHIIDTPIKSLRLINTNDLPQEVRKKYKDGWRPILTYMCGEVAQMLEITPVAAMDQKFVQQTFDVAMAALASKAPGIFADSNSDKCSTWKVATWSRKIREHSLGQQQLRGRQSIDKGVTPLKTNEDEMKGHSQNVHAMMNEEI